MPGQRNFAYQSSVYRTKGASPYGYGKRKRDALYSRRVSTRRVSAPTGVLDVAGFRYARLLRDPVNAPVVPPAMNGGVGGQILRFSLESTLMGTTGTEAVFAWTPGIGCVIPPPTLLADNPYPVITGTAAAGGNPVLGGLTPTYAPNWVPGYTFMSTNATTYRCIAADVEVIYNGTEANRGGILYLATGVDNFGLLNAPTTSRSVSTIFGGIAQKAIRMPDGGVHVRFRPGMIDQEFTNCGPLTTVQAAKVLDGSSSIGIGITGMPVGSTVNLRVTAVYEFIPSPALNLVIPNSTGDVSNNTTQQVVSHNDKTKPNWAYQVGEGIADAVLGAVNQQDARRGQGLLRN